MKKEGHGGEIACIIGNFTRKKISEENIQRAVRETAKEVGGQRKTEGAVLYIYIYIVGASRSALLNEKFRGTHKAADVLSFPPEPLLEASGRDKSLTRGVLRLDAQHLACEIVLCPEAVERHAKKAGRSFQDEWAHALVHGTLHVLGYHHEESAKRERDLQEKENSICQALGRGIPHPEV